MNPFDDIDITVSDVVDNAVFQNTKTINSDVNNTGNNTGNNIGNDPDNNCIIPLKYKYDILAEVLLTYKYGCTATDKYDKDEECAVCYDNMKDTYTITLSCGDKHTFHRNCVLTMIQMEQTKNYLSRSANKCPACFDLMKKNPNV